MIEPFLDLGELREIAFPSYTNDENLTFDEFLSKTRNEYFEEIAKSRNIPLPLIEVSN